MVETATDAQTRLEIQRLVTDHAWLIDHGQAGRIVALYTQDARVLGIGPDKVGHAAIEQWAGEREAMTGRRSRHVQTNMRLQPVTTDEWHGTVVLTLYRHDGPGRADPAPFLVGEYADIYRKDRDGAYRFGERQLTILFGG